MLYWVHSEIVRALFTPLIIRTSFYVPFYTEYSEKPEQQAAYLRSLCMFLVIITTIPVTANCTEMIQLSSLTVSQQISGHTNLYSLQT